MRGACVWQGRWMVRIDRGWHDAVAGAACMEAARGAHVAAGLPARLRIVRRPAAGAHIVPEIPAFLPLSVDGGHPVPQRNKPSRKPPRQVAAAQEKGEHVVKCGPRCAARGAEHAVHQGIVALSCEGQGHEKPFVRQALLPGGGGSAACAVPRAPAPDVPPPLRRTGPPCSIHLGLPMQVPSLPRVKRGQGSEPACIPFNEGHPPARLVAVVAAAARGAVAAAAVIAVVMAAGALAAPLPRLPHGRPRAAAAISLLPRLDPVAPAPANENAPESGGPCRPVAARADAPRPHACRPRPPQRGMDSAGAIVILQLQAALCQFRHLSGPCSRLPPPPPKQATATPACPRSVAAIPARGAQRPESVRLRRRGSSGMPLYGARLCQAVGLWPAPQGVDWYAAVPSLPPSLPPFPPPCPPPGSLVDSERVVLRKEPASIMADSSRPARVERPAAGDGSRRQGRREWRAALRELHRSENGRPRPSTARKAGGPLAAGATYGRSYGISSVGRP